MAKCTFKNLTPQQADELSLWFEGPLGVKLWDMICRYVASPLIDERCRKILRNGDIVVYCNENVENQMLGHNPIKLNRLDNLLSTLDASKNWLELLIQDPQMDSDLSVLETMVKDALEAIEKLKGNL